jgi:hypothetical protein
MTWTVGGVAAVAVGKGRSSVEYIGRSSSEDYMGQIEEGVVTTCQVSKVTIYCLQFRSPVRDSDRSLGFSFVELTVWLPAPTHAHDALNIVNQDPSCIHT